MKASPLHASQRKLNPNRSKPHRPWHPHDDWSPLEPCEPVDRLQRHGA